MLCTLCALCARCSATAATATTSATAATSATSTTSAISAASAASTASTAFRVVHAARGGERVQLRRAVDERRIDEHECPQARGGGERRKVRAFG
jgi:hypothetical protein